MESRPAATLPPMYYINRSLCVQNAVRVYARVRMTERVGRRVNETPLIWEPALFGAILFLLVRIVSRPGGGLAAGLTMISPIAGSQRPAAATRQGRRQASGYRSLIIKCPARLLERAFTSRVSSSLPLTSLPRSIMHGVSVSAVEPLVLRVIDIARDDSCSCAVCSPSDRMSNNPIKMAPPAWCLCVYIHRMTP